MTSYWSDYFWKNGRPQGRNLEKFSSSSTLPDLQEQEVEKTVSYKIISDPYFRYISVEMYLNNAFTKIVYDSRLLNFRHLKPEFQNGWEKEPLNETSAWIRNEYNQVVFKEVYCFSEDLCTSSTIFSVHGIHLATQSLHYTCLGDSFDGTILKDPTGRIVLIKRYSFDEESRQFTDLLKSVTDFSNNANFGFLLSNLRAN